MDYLEYLFNKIFIFMQFENGTNFVGANNKLNFWIKPLDQTKRHNFSNRQI